MIAGHRRRHRWTWWVLVVLLPLLAFLALRERAEFPDQPAPAIARGGSAP